MSSREKQIIAVVGPSKRQSSHLFGRRRFRGVFNKPLRFDRVACITKSPPIGYLFRHRLETRWRRNICDIAETLWVGGFRWNVYAKAAYSGLFLRWASLRCLRKSVPWKVRLCVLAFLLQFREWPFCSILEGRDKFVYFRAQRGGK